MERMSCVRREDLPSVCCISKLSLSTVTSVNETRRADILEPITNTAPLSSCDLQPMCTALCCTACSLRRHLHSIPFHAVYPLQDTTAANKQTNKQKTTRPWWQIFRQSLEKSFRAFHQLHPASESGNSGAFLRQFSHELSKIGANCDRGCCLLLHSWKIKVNYSNAFDVDQQPSRLSLKRFVQGVVGTSHFNGLSSSEMFIIMKKLQNVFLPTPLYE